MKNVLLTALSLILLSTCPVQAEDHSSAGLAKPIKLGAGDRDRPPARAPQAGLARPTSAAPGTPIQVGTPQAQAPTGWHNVVPGQKTGFANPGVTNVITTPAGQKTAFGGKALVPPPPQMMNLGPATIIQTPQGKKVRRGVAPEKMVTVGTGGPYNFLGHQSKEEFATTFNWQPDSPNDSLTFKANFTPIGGGNPHFNWIRILLGSQVIADERTLSHKSFWVFDLTGKVDRGINQIVVQGQGTPGCTFDWKLQTPKKCQLKSLEPDEVLVGKDLVLKGKDFDPSPTKDIVNIGSKTLTPSSATDKELKVRIPKDFTPGEYMVKVTVDGLSSHELKVTIRGIPELTGTNLNGVPPGAQLVIFGKNFSKKPQENQVLFDGTAAQVVNSTTEEITVVVPNFQNEMVGDTARISGQVGIPIRVKVGKIDAINTVPINVGNSTWQDPGLKGGPDAPQVPVDWRRLLEN